jgi:hypothetical protein
MTFNNTINHLKLWCINKAKAYQQVYGNYGGITYVGYQVAYEMEFKLSTLIDKSFDSVADLKREVVNLIDVHYEPSVLNPQNSLAKHIIDKTNREFCEFLEDIFAKSEALTLADIPYTRAIVGAEATTLQDKFRSVWGYVNTSYWFPLMGDHPKEISEKFFIMYDYLEPYMKQVEQIIGLPQTHIYSYGEDVSRPPNCLETVEIIEYGGCETIYTDKDFTWAIYFSHENTVAFAGSIVPKIKELLSNESEHWNEFEWDLG